VCTCSNIRMNHGIIAFIISNTACLKMFGHSWGQLLGLLSCFNPSRQTEFLMEHKVDKFWKQHVSGHVNHEYMLTSLCFGISVSSSWQTSMRVHSMSILSSKSSISSNLPAGRNRHKQTWQLRASFHHTLPQKYIEMALSAYLLLLTKHLNMGSPEMFERDWPKMTPKFPMDYQWIMMINPCQSSVPIIHWPFGGLIFKHTKAQTDWATGVSELCELPSCADLLPEHSAPTPISWNWGSWEFAAHFGVPPANHWSKEGAPLNPILHRFLMVYRYFERSIPHPWNQSSGWIIMIH
jgi:hypothetical protein